MLGGGDSLVPLFGVASPYQRVGPVVSVAGGLIVPPNPPVGDKKVAAPWRQEGRRSCARHGLYLRDERSQGR